LPQLNLQITFHCTLAGKTPPRRDLLGRQPLPLRPVNFRLPLQNLNAAAPAPALPATGEFNSLFEQQVAQRGSGARGEFDPRGPKNNPMGWVCSQELSL
jgi:hypothetical protein